MDPAGSIASVWPHPLPPASVPSFADNSTPNSSPPAPSRASHLSVSPLVLFSLFRHCETAFTTPIRIPQIPHTYTFRHTYKRGLRRCVRVRGFITGVVHAETYALMLETSLCLCVAYARARAHTTSRVCVHGGYMWVQRGGRARGDPFFSVSPVLSSYPFYARALLC